MGEDETGLTRAPEKTTLNTQAHTQLDPFRGTSWVSGTIEAVVLNEDVDVGPQAGEAGAVQSWQGKSDLDGLDELQSA